MKFLRHVIKLCFPDNHDALFNHTDGRYATSPLALVYIVDRLQRLVSGGSTSCTLHLFHHHRYQHYWRAIAMMFIRPSVCLSVWDRRAL